MICKLCLQPYETKIFGACPFCGDDPARADVIIKTGDPFYYFPDFNRPAPSENGTDDDDFDEDW